MKSLPPLTLPILYEVTSNTYYRHCPTLSPTPKPLNTIFWYLLETLTLQCKALMSLLNKDVFKLSPRFSESRFLRISHCRTLFIFCFCRRDYLRNNGGRLDTLHSLSIESFISGRPCQPTDVIIPQPFYSCLPTQLFTKFEDRKL